MTGRLITPSRKSLIQKLILRIHSASKRERFCWVQSKGDPFFVHPRTANATVRVRDMLRIEPWELTILAFAR